MKNKQMYGFTLVEILITLALSTVMMTAMSKVFIDSGTSFRKQKSLSYLVQDGRYVQQMLAKEFRRAGFLRNRFAAGMKSIDIFNADSNVLGSGINLQAGEYIRADFDGDGFSGDEFDTNRIVFRYQLNDINDLGSNSQDYAASPCTRNIRLNSGEDPETERILVTLYYYVQFDDTTGSPVLYCKAKRENLDDSTNNETSAALPLVSNVERLYALYGLINKATNNDTRYPSSIEELDELNVAHYLRADQVNSTVPTGSDPVSSSWELVRSVKLYVVLGSEDENMISSTPQYRLDGRDYSVSSPADKRLYKVFSSTLALRNI